MKQKTMPGIWMGINNLDPDPALRILQKKSTKHTVKEKAVKMVQEDLIFVLF